MNQLTLSTMDEEEKTKMKRKFGICYMLARGLANCLKSMLRVPPSESCSADHAVQLWWSDRAQGQINPQGESTGRVSPETDDGDASNADPTEPTLDAWDAWFT